MTRSAGNFYENDGIERPPRSSGNDGYPGHPKGKAGFYNQDDLSFTPEYEKEDSGLATPRLERKQYAKTEQRTIVAKNLSDRATHQDVRLIETWTGSMSPPRLKEYADSQID